MTLRFRARLAARRFSVEVEVAPGEHVAVLGHNGGGKSTLLAILAGTLRPDEGRAALDRDVLFDLGGTRHRWTPPHRRGIALLAQEALLFPHLTVAENVAFGPRAAGMTRASARTVAGRWLEEVGASDLSDRRPGELSGGQAQRVAVARALATEPRVLLLDEPLASLDIAVAPLLRRLLRRVLADRQALLVTHDPLDALLLTDRTLVLEHGRVAESGATDDVLRHPRTGFAAGLAGLNLVRGVAGGGGVRHDSGLRVEGVHRPGDDLRDGEPAAAAFGPSAVSVHLVPPGGSPRNHFGVTVSELEPRGELVRVRGDVRGLAVAADLTPHAVAELDLHPGSRATFAIKASAVTIYPI